ncbi:hypothetical protein ACJMK2_039516 [Sinanodonta woodiana]|uniref:Uncharacterized protein n=1 Tax=Sinanodonta woodiana TaxID=1069815 RepID=A0ABD3WFJ2_SINWO
MLEEISEEEAEMTQQGIHHEHNQSSTSKGTRKSKRSRKQTRSYSPDTVKKSLKSKLKRRKRKGGNSNSATTFNRPCDKLPNGMPFSCYLCKSPYVCNDTVRSLKKKKQSRHMPYPRCKINPQTGQEMLLCNACGLAFDRPIRQKKPKKVLSEKERDDYLTKARQFAKALVEKFGEPAASRLYCPPITDRICGCIQKYIMVNDEICETRGQELIEMLRKALQLSKEKCYSTADTAASSRKSRSKNVGLGSGHKRSKIYTEFVLKSRSHLKKEIGLCERGSQRILLYSNNFLHKTLKTEKNSSRLLKRKFLEKLVTFSEILAKPCCVYNCVMMAATHCRLLEKWRERALTSQAEARRVMAEMLTPAGGNRVNCNLFISLVTGCSKQTIHRVKQQMQTTQGDKEPPVHGLRKYWQEVQQKQGKSDTTKASQKTSPVASTVTVATTSTTTTASESTGPISDIATNAAKNAQASVVPANSVAEPARHIATTNPTASDVQHQCHLMKIQQHLVEHHLQLQQILKQHLIQKNHIHNSSPSSHANTTPTDRQSYVNSQNQTLRHMAALQRTSMQPIQGTQQILTPLNVPVQSQFAQNQPSQQIPCRQIQTSCNAQIYSAQPPLQVQIQTLQAPSTTQNQSIQAPYLTQIPQLQTSHSTQIHQMSASQHPRIHPTSVQTLIPHFQAPQPSWITQLQQLQASSQPQINQVQVSSQAPIQTIHVSSQNPPQTFQLLMPGPTQLQTNIPQGAPVQHILDNCSQNSFQAVQTMQPNCGNQNQMSDNLHTQLQQFINLNQQISTHSQLMSNLVYMSNQNQYPVMNTMPPNQYQSIMNMSDTNSSQSQQAYNPFSAVRSQLQQGQNQIQTLSTKLPCPANQVQPVLSGTQVSSTAANSAVITLPIQMLSSHPVSTTAMVTQGDNQHNSTIQAQGYVKSTILDHQRNTNDKLYQKSPSVSQDFGSHIPIQTTSSHHVQNVRTISRKVNQAVQTVNSANPRNSQSTQIQRMAQRLVKTPVPLQATKQSVRQALIHTSIQNKFAEQLQNLQTSTASANNPHQHYFVETQNTRALQQSVQESFEQPSISGMILPNTQTPNESLEQQNQRYQWQMQMQNASALLQRDGYIEHSLRGVGHVHVQNKQPCENQQRQAAENRSLLHKSKDINSHRQNEMSMSSDRHAVARSCNPAIIGGHKLYAVGSTAGFELQQVGHQPMEVDSHVDDELMLQTSNSQSLAFTGNSLHELLKRASPSISIHSHTSQLQSNSRHSTTQKENKEGRPISYLNMSSARHSGVEMNSIPNANGNKCPRKATIAIPNAVISKITVDAAASANISMQTHDGSGGKTAHNQNRSNQIFSKQEEATCFDSSERQSRANDSSEESGKLKAARGSISFKMKTQRSKGLVSHTFRKVQSKDGKLLMQSGKNTFTQRQPTSGHSILQDILEAPPKFTSSQLIEEATKTSKTAGQSSY